MTHNLNMILKLGNPKLYEISRPLKEDDLPEAIKQARIMAGLVAEYRRRHGAGRAIAAPQIGYMRRMIVLNITRPQMLINPRLEDKSNEMIELWDDCMSFPNLLVKVNRHKSCRIRFLDEHWEEQSWWLENDLSELLQHECDHLDGILATQRAVDNRAFCMNE